MRFRDILVLGVMTSLALGLSACGKDEDEETESALNGHPTDLPIDPQLSGGEKLSDGSLSPKRTVFCFPNSVGNYVGEIGVPGKGTDGDKLWAQGGACVFRSFDQVWAAAKSTEFMRWKRGIKSIKSNFDNPPDGVVSFYRVEYQAETPFGVPAVKWTMNWFHSVPQGFGTPSAPKRVVIRYGKVKGTSHIRSWTGGLVIDEIAPGITAVAVRNDIDAEQTNLEDDAVGTVVDLVSDLRKL